jgi:hypothetical protein
VFLVLATIIVIAAENQSMVKASARAVLKYARSSQLGNAARLKKKLAKKLHKAIANRDSPMASLSYVVLLEANAPAAKIATFPNSRTTRAMVIEALRRSAMVDPSPRDGRAPYTHCRITEPRAATLGRLPTRQVVAAHPPHPARWSYAPFVLAGLARDEVPSGRALTAKLTANDSDRRRWTATGMDGHEPSGCGDACPRTAVDMRERVSSPPLYPAELRALAAVLPLRLPAAW